jgi:hypothetical protein
MTPLRLVDKVELRPIGGLIPNARNARTHSDRQVDQNFAGDEATLEATGQTFAEVSGERLN